MQRKFILFITILAVICMVPFKAQEKHRTDQKEVENLRASINELASGLVDTDYHAYLAKQWELYQYLDHMVLNDLNSGMSIDQVNAALLKFQGDNKSIIAEHFQLYGVQAGGRTVVFARYQVSFAGPSVFRIFDQVDGRYARVYASDRTEEQYEYTEDGVRLLIMPPHKNVIPFVTLSGLTGNGLPIGSLVCWNYDVDAQNVEVELSFLNKPGLLFQYTPSKNKLVVEFCVRTPLEVDQNPSACNRMVKYVMDVNDDFSLGPGRIIPNDNSVVGGPAYSQQQGIVEPKKK